MRMLTLPKTAAEKRTYRVPFGIQPEFDAPSSVTIATIDTFTWSPAAEVVITNPSAIGSDVFFTADAGTAGTRYFWRMKVTLTDATELEGAGVLSVIDPAIPSV